MKKIVIAAFLLVLLMAYAIVSAFKEALTSIVVQHNAALDAIGTPAKDIARMQAEVNVLSQLIPDWLGVEAVMVVLVLLVIGMGIALYKKNQTTP